MPTLPIPRRTGFEAPVAGGRRATAADFGGGVDLGGKAIQQAAVGYLAETEESEARKALVSASEIRAKYARELDAAAMDGRDLGALKEKMQDELAQVGADFQTKRGQDSLALYQSNTELMYDEQANRIAVQRAAATARLEGSKFLTSAGKILQSNPLYLEVAEKDAEAFGQTLAGIRPEQRAEIVDGLKRELNMSAAIAAARINPEQARKDLDAGKWNLTPDQRNLAINRADTESRARRAEESYLRAEEERQRREADGKARDKHFKTIIDGGASRRAIMDDADLLPATREHLIDYMTLRQRAARGEEKVSDAAAVRDLWLRIHAADDDPRKILNGGEIVAAVKSGLINTRDGDKLLTDVASQKDENNRAIGFKLSALSSKFERAVAADPRMFAYTAPERAEIANNYTARVMEQVQEMRKANDAKGLRDLFDPNSKTYVGSATFMQQAIDDIAEKKRAAATTAALSENVVFPDGKTRRYSGKGNKLDPANWIEVTGSTKESVQFPFTPSGETESAREERARRELSAKYNAWREEGAAERVDFMEWLLNDRR